MTVLADFFSPKSFGSRQCINNDMVDFLVWFVHLRLDLTNFKIWQRSNLFYYILIHKKLELTLSRDCTRQYFYLVTPVVL